MSPRNCTVQLPSGAYCLAMTAGADRDTIKVVRTGGESTIRKSSLHVVDRNTSFDEMVHKLSNFTVTPAVASLITLQILRQ